MLLEHTTQSDPTQELLSDWGSNYNNNSEKQEVT